MIPLSESAFWGPMAVTIMGGLAVRDLPDVAVPAGDLRVLAFRKSLGARGAAMSRAARGRTFARRCLRPRNSWSWRPVRCSPIGCSPASIISAVFTLAAAIGGRTGHPDERSSTPGESGASRASMWPMACWRRLVVIVGVARVIWGVKGYEYYRRQPYFLDQDGAVSCRRPVVDSARRFAISHGDGNCAPTPRFARRRRKLRGCAPISGRKRRFSWPFRSPPRRWRAATEYRSGFFREVGPALAGDPQRFLAPPSGDAGVIAGQQNVGDRAPLPFARARIMGIFEQAAIRSFPARQFRLAHHAGQQADAGVEHGERRDLAAGQDVVADRDFVRSRASITRSSTPSKRAQTMTRPGPAAHSRAWACVNGLPRGLISRRGRGIRQRSARRRDRRPAHRRA